MLLYTGTLKTLAQRLRNNTTEAERKLWARLRHKQLHGRQFYRQKPIGNYIVDFYCPAEKLVIEVDGGQHYTDAGLLKDAERDQYLKGIGLTVLRFSDADVLRQPLAVLDAIFEKMA